MGMVTKGTNNNSLIMWKASTWALQIESRKTSACRILTNCIRVHKSWDQLHQTGRIISLEVLAAQVKCLHPSSQRRMSSLKAGDRSSSSNSHNSLVTISILSLDFRSLVTRWSKRYRITSIWVSQILSTNLVKETTIKFNYSSSNINNMKNHNLLLEKTSIKL